MNFEPVWVATKGHLKQFRVLYQGRSWLSLMFSPVLAPIDFPQANIRGRWAPVVYSSNGIISLEGTTLGYVASSKGGLSHRGIPYRNLKVDLRFSVDVRTLSVVTRFQAEAVPMKRFEMNWIELAGGALPDSLLICIGAQSLLLSKARKATDQLYSEIQKLRGITSYTG